MMLANPMRAVRYLGPGQPFALRAVSVGGGAPGQAQLWADW